MNIKRTLYLLLILSAVSSLALFLQYRGSRDFSRRNPRPLDVVLGGDVFVGPRLKHYTKPEAAGSFVDSISDRTASADLHLANLEAPLTGRGDTYLEKTYHLRNAPSVSLPILEELSVDGVSLANNHMMDYGPRGLLSTLRLLDKNGIRYTGAGASLREAVQPVFFERKGRTIGFLSFSNTYPREFWANVGKPGTAYGEPRVVEAMTSFASRYADRVIVSFHWGGEGKIKPKRYQIALAHRAVDAGADVVFGHHPHTIQPMERYRDALIFYSLGNYVFTTLSHEVNYGLLARVKFLPNQAPEVRYHVLNVDNYDVHYRPKLVRTLTDPLKLSLYIKRPDFVRLADRTRNWVNPFDSFVTFH